MAANRHVFFAHGALLLAAGLLAGLFGLSGAARAQTAFGQEMPQQYFLNRMTNPHPQATPQGGTGGPGGAQGAQAGAPGSAQAAAEDDDDGPGPYPKRYLLNRMFNWGGGQPAPAAAPAPAQSPAATAAGAAPASAAK